MNVCLNGCAIACAFVCVIVVCVWACAWGCVFVQWFASCGNCCVLFVCLYVCWCAELWCCLSCVCLLGWLRACYVVLVFVRVRVMVFGCDS